MKKEVTIKGCDLGTLKKGHQATLIMEDGRMIKSSPVVNYYVANLAGVIYIETANSIYTYKSPAYKWIDDLNKSHKFFVEKITDVTVGKRALLRLENGDIADISKVVSIKGDRIITQNSVYHLLRKVG